MTTIVTRPDTLLPDPEPRTIRYTIISVDDHLVEPPDMFEGRLPAKYVDHAPRIVENEFGHQLWEFDGERYTQVAMNAVAGRKKEFIKVEPVRFEDIRPGCWNIDARVKDQDLNGVWASLNFPSQITGFSGRVFSLASDPGLGVAVTKAWNDWLYDEWWQPYPDRSIPCGITFLSDPELGAEEVRRNAERGFRAVTLPERPHKAGLPSLFSGYWEPIVAACAETDTVICLHVGSSGMADYPDDSPRLGLGATLFGQLSLSACAEWLWSELPVRYPNLKIAMSEGGIGWVAMLLDRLDNVVDRSGYGEMFADGKMRPADVLQRNFWFCTIDDPSTIGTRERIGIDHVMIEVDYPHGDSTWPDTQDVIDRYWGHLPVDDLRKLIYANAAELFRWPLPPDPKP
jgi:predicted TIM-barrel fold metal-dependent hydrolase